jgi:hypothetical protein
MRSPNPMIVLDTIGKLHARGYGIFGTCIGCAARYRMDAPPGACVSNFDIDLEALIAERGAATSIIGMVPVACPRCGGLRTEIRVITPK